MNNIVTKNSLSKNIYLKLGISTTLAAKILSEIIKHIYEALNHGEEVKITRFGSFKIRHKKARKGRNPKTMEEYIIKERKTITFHSSKNLKELINKDDKI